MMTSSEKPATNRTLTRRHFLRTVTWTVAASGGLTAWARCVEPWWLEFTEHEITIRDLPAPLDGLRIVQLSDIHNGPRMPESMIHRAVALANSWRPDLTVVTGDHLGGPPRHVWPLARILSQLRARCGVLAILGNHDYGIYSPGAAAAEDQRPELDLAREVCDAFKRYGIPVLRNQVFLLDRHGASLPIVGLDDLWSNQCRVTTLDSLPPAQPRVVLAHNPDTVAELGGRRADLILAGHTHGGQVALPLLGPPVVPTRLKQFSSGFYRLGADALYVNRGIGFVWRPVRLLARPEVTGFILRCPREAPLARRGIAARARPDPGPLPPIATRVRPAPHAGRLSTPGA